VGKTFFFFFNFKPYKSDKTEEISLSVLTHHTETDAHNRGYSTVHEPTI